MKLTGIFNLNSDLNAYARCCNKAGICIDTIYEIGEYDEVDGYIEFNDNIDGNDGWYIGCSYGIRFRFEDNSTVEFDKLYRYGERNPDKINEVLDFLRTSVLSVSEPDTEPDTEMPDIF